MSSIPPDTPFRVYFLRPAERHSTSALIRQIRYREQVQKLIPPFLSEKAVLRLKNDRHAVSPLE